MHTNHRFRVAWVLPLFLLWSGFSYGQSIYRIDYKRSAAISDQAGKPKTAQTLYFPPERFIDSSEVLVRIPKNRITDVMRNDPLNKGLPDSMFLESQLRAEPETFMLNRFSNYLYNLEEPVLYNYPLHKDVYRLTCLRSFHPPIVVSLEKMGEVIQLHTKMLTQNPRLPGFRYSDRNGTIQVADTSARIPFRINTVRRISRMEYDRYVALLDSLKELSMSPLGISVLGVDGSRWILETHRPEGYYFFTRFTPTGKDPIRMLGDYLLDLSAVKKEERY